MDVIWKIIPTSESVEDIDKIGLGWGRSTTFIIYSKDERLSLEEAGFRKETVCILRGFK